MKKEGKKQNKEGRPVYGTGGSIRGGEAAPKKRDSVLSPKKGSLKNFMLVTEASLKS